MLISCQYHTSLTKDLTESELIDLVRAQSRDGFDLLYQNYSATLYGVICRIVTDTTVAEDLLQEVFVKVWNNIGQYDAGKGRLFTWMINISRNAGIDYLRSKEHKKQQKVDSNDRSMAHISDDKLANDIDNIGLKSVVDGLDQKHKEIIDLVFFGGYTYDEASKVLGIPLGTLKTRVRTALQILRGKL